MNDHQKLNDNQEMCVDQLEQKLKDRDIIGVAAKASSTFTFTLSRDEIKTCILNATWKAMKKYKKDGGCKFTTYLYRGVVMECLTQQKFNISHCFKSTHNNIPDLRNNYTRIDFLDEINTKCEDPGLVYDRFYKNMTIKELAKQRGVCGETIRIKLKKNLKKLKNFIT